jgi:hypothetical protein
MHPDFYFILYYIHCMMLLLHLNNMLFMSQKKSSSLVLCEAMAGKTPGEMATSSTMCERGGGRERQNTGQNQTDK